MGIKQSERLDMMNRNRLTDKLPAFYTCAAISRNGNLSRFNPSSPPVSFNAANIEVGFLARPILRYVSVAANAIAKLSVMSTGALLVIPRRSLKRTSAVVTEMRDVRDQSLAFVGRRLPFVGRRQPKPVFIADGMASIIIPVLRRVAAVALLRAKTGCFYAVVRDAVFFGARRAFECGHGKKMPNPDQMSRHYLGSGSIAIAAHYAGVHLTACEIDADYFHAAKARIERETSQMDFLTPRNV
jgi:hypothetical protein